MNENTVYSCDFVDMTEKVPPKKKLYKPFGIVSMVFGILSLALQFASLWLPLSSLYPLVGLLFASFDRKRNKERSVFGLVGYVTSLIAFIIQIIMAILLIIYVLLVVLFLLFTFKYSVLL